MGVSLAWNDDFPKGYGHTSIAFLKRCLGFVDAKKGNLEAAQFVVGRCVKLDRIYELKERFPNAVLLPVLSENQLPLALAQAICLPIWLNVALLHTVSRKDLCAFQRLLHKPVFAGYVERGVAYILVDDIVTQGGTIAALREFVMVRGGMVVAIVALAFAVGSRTIAPVKNHTAQLMVKFGAALILLLRKLRIAGTVQELTNSQVKYLLRFTSIKNIEKKLLCSS